MYFPVGWPKVLHSNGVTKGKPLKVFRHRSKNYVIELRGRSIAFWHSRLKLLVSSYVRSRECLEKHGHNVTAALKPDGTAVVIATSKGHLLFLRLLYEGFSTSNSQSTYSTQEHGILLHHNPHLNVSGDGNELELVSIKYSTETAVVGGILSVVTVGGNILVSTGYGMLHRVSWEGKFDSSMMINLNLVPFSNDLLPEIRGQPLGEGSKVYAQDIIYSLELHGFSIVLNDGRGGFLTNKSPRYEPQSMQVVWIKDLCGAVCTAANAKYQLLAFGKENGAVDVFSVDEASGVWNLSHTLQFTKQQFPETGVQLGAVQCLEWSHADGMVIAVSWKNGGLSLWSVFGSLLLCSLGDQPGTPSPLNPHCTVLESLCWSSDSYHLWMLPTDTTKKPLSVADTLHLKDETSHGSSVGDRLTNHDEGEEGNSNGDHVLVMQFMRNAIVDNPIIANHQHLFLQGSERLYLNNSRSVADVSHDYKSEGSSTIDRMVSAPQWKVVQLPLSYLVLNWPIKYAALNSTGTNLAVAGKAGFALYSGSRRKWKLFGNEVQEQSLVCRGGLAWYKDIVVFPCRVYERTEEIRFYSLHSNLDNSQLLENLKSSSPILCLNIHGDYLILASRDHHMTILGLSATTSPSKGLVLTVSKLHEIHGKTFPQPWSTKLISVIPSNIRTEPAFSQHHSLSRGGAVVHSKQGPRQQPTPCSIDSVLFNFSGKLLMIQRDTPSSTNVTIQEEMGEQEQFFFATPVCLAGSVEAIWTPPYQYRCSDLADQHLMDSLWLACGASGIKVWLPLHPQDESHPTFLSKRIMLTLPMTVYPQAVVFTDAVLYGLSHETSYTETRLTSRHSFPFATIERTTHVFLHHILRQLLRRNLGSHAFQIARSCSHLPYFSHVLELMLHEILEEEAPGSMPVPDALLPRVVEFIKQFPEFLETVGHCARKTEVALWQYLFAAVGNPRDLFDLCISDGRLKTAATYLIIIQNLETAAVSRQLATRLLDAALDSNRWELCKDLVRFLRAIGPGDALDSPLITTPLKTPTPTPSPMTSLSFNERMTPTVAVPDLDRSAMNVTRDHLSSGSVSSVVSLSGDYKDASGKVIRRPQFVMDVDSKEEYFIELILCRHARKLLTARCLRDLGKFAAHLDFNLQMWLARERLRAAKVDDFVSTVRELHKEFQWPFPLYNATKEQSNLFSPSSTLQSLTPQELDTPTSETTPIHNTPTTKLLLPDEMSKKESPLDDETSSLTSSLKRTNRPPDLDLTPAQNQLHNVILEPTQKSEEGGIVTDNSKLLSIAQGEFDPTRSSTPTRHSGSISERVSLVLKQNPSSVDLNGEGSSLGDIAEESDLEVYSDVNMATEKGGSSLKGSAQAEKEIRYFIGVMLEAQCMEWTLLLSILLLDSSLVIKVVDIIQKQSGVLDTGALTRLMRGYDELYVWAETDCPGYVHFLSSIQSYFKLLNSLLEEKQSPVASSSVNTPVSMNVCEERVDSTQMLLKEDEVDGQPSSPQTNADAESTSACTVS